MIAMLMTGHVNAEALFRHARFSLCPALCPGTHVFRADRDKDVDGRDKPGHDAG
jgi:hypothetical protein